MARAMGLPVATGVAAPVAVSLHSPCRGAVPLRVAAGDVKAGRAKAQMCQACHGIDGLSKVPDAPNLAGQTAAYVAAQLQAFKSGARKNEAMSLVASTLSDPDIDNLAAYYSAIEIKVVTIPGQ